MLGTQKWTSSFEGAGLKLNSPEGPGLENIHYPDTILTVSGQAHRILHNYNVTLGLEKYQTNSVSGASFNKSDQAISQVMRRPSFATPRHENGPLVKSNLHGHGPMNGFSWKIKNRTLSNGVLLSPVSCLKDQNYEGLIIGLLLKGGNYRGQCRRWTAPRNLANFRGENEGSFVQGGISPSNDPDQNSPSIKTSGFCSSEKECSPITLQNQPTGKFGSGYYSNLEFRTKKKPGRRVASIPVDQKEYKTSCPQALKR